MNFTVTLPAPAGPSGVTVNLAKSSSIVTMPTSVFIPAGATTGSVSVLAINVGNVTITATANGYTQAQGVIVIGATITWDDRTTVVMQPGERRTFFLHMGQRAPWPDEGGITFNFNSTNPDVASLRSHALRVPWQTSECQRRFPVTGSGDFSTRNR